MVAARAMLDTEHGRPAERGAAAAADDNNYFLGSIAGHNVVIACLPVGSSGPASAATVAGHMQRSFPGVRIGLLVGVGSGAPGTLSDDEDQDDIRLGDVVVSTPDGSSGGVIEFQREAAVTAHDICGIDDGDGVGGIIFGKFVRARCLNKPPTMLRTALSSLQMEHELSGSRVGELLAQAAARHPRLQSKLVAPQGGGGGRYGDVDRLYQAGYVHVGRSGGSCHRCDASMLVRRPDRPFDGPAIHYGVIASGEQSIACGVMRCRAKADLGPGVLCFDREAAGLMDNFPCLVVRGIDNYADTHTSALWRSYAAGTAAAFTRELLENMPPRNVEQIPTISEVIREGETQKFKRRIFCIAIADVFLFSQFVRQ